MRHPATLLLMLCLCQSALASPFGIVGEAKCTDVVWAVKEQLQNVETNAVVLSMMTEAASDLKVEWGTVSRKYTASAEDLAVAAETLAKLDLTSLSAGTRYYYRVACRLDGQTKWGFSGEYTFKTLESSTSATVTVAIVSDSHTFPTWSKSGCGDQGDGDFQNLAELRQTLRNVVQRQPDFVIAGGDDTHPHCATCVDSCSIRGNGAGTGSATSQAEAEARYEIRAKEWHNLSRLFPIFQVQGNHEGDTGFGNTEGDCAQPTALAGHSAGARAAYVPNPADVYDDPAGLTSGTAIRWTSGAAEFWILDPYQYYPGGGGGRAPEVGTCSGSAPGAEDCLRNNPDDVDEDCPGVETCVADATQDYPTFATDWTLGAAQDTWFDTTFAASTAKWKFVFIHKLVGGIGSIEGAGLDQTGAPWEAALSCYHYGRGLHGAVEQYCSVTTATVCLNDADCPGGESCVDPVITDPFKGEQEDIHTVLKNNIEGGGANYFFIGHDHLWVAGPAKDSVHYMLMPHPQGGRPGWADRAYFAEAYDYDDDDVAEYDDVGGAAGDENGFFLITINGTTSVNVKMIETDIVTPANNNTVLYTYP